MYSTDVKSQEQLPKPMGYKVLIAVPSTKEITDGGILLPDSYLDVEKTASIYGNVIAMGPDAFGDAEKFPSGPYCAVGDWVIFRSYSGTRLRVNGEEFRLINDDTIEAVVEDPRVIQRA